MSFRGAPCVCVRHCQLRTLVVGVHLNQRHRHRHRQPLPAPTFSSLSSLSAFAVFSALAPPDAAPWPGDGCACGTQPLHPLLFLSPCALPSFPLCHFEPTVAELVVIALRWLHFRSLSSLLRLRYVSDAFAARIPSFLPSSFLSYPPPYPPLFVLQPAFAELTVLTCRACLYALFALCAFDTLCSFCARSAPCCVVAR